MTMLRIMVGPDDLAVSRFAVSPLGELQHLLRHLGGTGGRGNHLPSPIRTRWRERFAQVRHDPGIRALLALQSSAYGANFVAPPPNGVAQTLDDDLAAVRATPLSLARAEITKALAPGPAPEPHIARWLSRPDVVDQIADSLQMAWTALIAPDWPQLQAILERDVVHRAGRLTRSGWAGALTGMHRTVTWHSATVEIRERPNGQARLDGRGLLFVPSVFIYPGLGIYLDPPWRPALVYPARGSAALWEVQARPPASMRRLLGASRAHLLVALDSPTSTTQLVATTGMSLGAVGGHLRIMLDAGLLTRARSGRTVLYQRTPVGEALLSTTE
jgi:DNA-binding transcriptional ArsR family regulator